RKGRRLRQRSPGRKAVEGVIAWHPGSVGFVAEGERRECSRDVPPKWSASFDPCRVGWLERNEFVGAKPQSDFRGGVFQRVAAVYEIVLNTEGEVATNRRGCRFDSIGRPH